MVFMIVLRNSFDTYTAKDSVNDRLYMTESEVLRDFDKLQAETRYPLAIAGA